MTNGRRAFLAGFAALAASRLWAGQLQEGIPGSPNGRQGTPGAPQPRFPDSVQPGSSDEDRTGPNIDPHAILKQNQKQILKDMAQLESLVSDLRKQVNTIDSANVLSMDLIHKAEEIEKLARQIKTLARGM
jgi:hypothetical protein